MGCSASSQQKQDVNANETETIASGEDSRNGLKAEATASGRENVGKELHREESLDIFSPQESRDVISAVTNTQVVGERSFQKAGVVNAWGASNGKLITQRAAVTNGFTNEQTGFQDSENEYGRDGVDKISSDVTENRENEIRIESLSSRVSSDAGSQFDNFALKQRVLIKEDTEEEFDPSTLIDIKKFKAANTPKTKLDQQGSESQEDTVELAGEANVGHDTRDPVVSPSNYNEFYDDDEKELIESIEKDFVISPPPALPGSVM